MAYNTITEATIKKVAKRYGDDSPEAVAITNVAKARLPFECLAELLLVNADDIKKDLTGGLPFDEPMHTILVNCVNTLLPLGIERGLLPCRDTAFTTEVLRVLVELLQLKQEIHTLQTTDNSTQ